MRNLIPIPGQPLFCRCVSLSPAKVCIGLQRVEPRLNPVLNHVESIIVNQFGNVLSLFLANIIIMNHSFFQKYQSFWPAGRAVWHRRGGTERCWAAELGIGRLCSERGRL